MIKNQLIKKKYYIYYTINKNNIIVGAIIYLLFNNFWKFYSLFLLFTLDLDPQFISKIWHNLNKIYDSKANLFIPFYSEINK